MSKSKADLTKISTEELIKLDRGINKFIASLKKEETLRIETITNSSQNVSKEGHKAIQSQIDIIKKDYLRQIKEQIELKKQYRQEIDKRAKLAIKEASARAKAIDKDSFLPDLYSSLEFFTQEAIRIELDTKTSEKGLKIKVKNPVSMAFREGFLHPINTIKAAKAGLKIKTALDQELKIKDKIDINDVLNTKVVKKILQDEHLFKILAMEKHRLNDFIEKNADHIAAIIADLIHEEAQVSQKTMLNILTTFMGNPEAVKTVSEIVDHSQLSIVEVVKKMRFQENLGALIPLTEEQIEDWIPAATELVVSLAKEEVFRQILEKRLILKDKEIEIDILGISQDFITIIQNEEIRKTINNFLVDNNILALTAIAKAQFTDQPEVLAFLTEESAKMTAKLVRNALTSPHEVESNFIKNKDLIAKILEINKENKAIAKYNKEAQEGVQQKLKQLKLSPNELKQISISTIELAKATHLHEVLTQDHLVAISLTKTAMQQQLSKLQSEVGLTEESYERLANNIIELVKTVSKEENLNKLAKLADYIDLSATDINREEKANKTIQLIEQALELAQDEELSSNLASLLSEDNAKDLYPFIPYKILSEFIDQDSLKLLSNFVQRLVANPEKLKSAFTENKAAIKKLIRETEAIKQNIVENNDLDYKEVGQLFASTLNLAKDLDLHNIIRDNQEVIEQQGKKILDKELESFITSEKTRQNIYKFLSKSAVIITKKANLEIIESIRPNLEVLLNDDALSKEQDKNIFELINKVKQIAKQPDAKDLYDDLIKILEDKDIQAQLDKMITTKPEAAKLGIKADKIVAVLKDKNALKELDNIFESLEKGQKFAVVSKGLKLFFRSKAVREITLTTIKNSIYNSIVSLNPFRKVMSNGKVKKLINDAHIHTTENEFINIGKIFTEEAKYNTGRYGLTLRSRDCSNFDFSGVNVSNSKFKEFNFKGATFGNDDSTDFSGSKFTNCNLAKIKIKGRSINLTNCVFDEKSFNSLLPVLKKFEQKGGEIKMENTIITTTKYNKYQELFDEEFCKKSKGKLTITPKKMKKNLSIKGDKPTFLQRLLQKRQSFQEGRQI